jgi:Tfp pilus assembly protein PilF
MLSLCLAARNHTNEARVEIVRVLEDERHDPLWNPPLWNNLAWVDLILGDPALHEEADHFSAMAYAASPETASIRGTRGAVLIEMGRIAEGMSLVLSAHDEHSLPRHRAFNAAHLAIGASATGREGQAAAYLERARAYDPNCPMIGRAQAALSRALEARRMTDT